MQCSRWCSRFVFVCPYILYADGQVGLEVVEVLCQLVAVVIVGEQALEKRQQLKETKNSMKWRRWRRTGEDNDEEKEKEERMKQDGRWKRRGGEFWKGRGRGKYTETVSFSRTLRTVNSELDLRWRVHATNWLNFPNNYHWGALEQDTKASKPQKTLVVVRSYWVLHVVQTTSESKLVCNFRKKKSLQSTKERERK